MVEKATATTSASPPDCREPAIEVVHLSRHFGRRKALDDISLHVPRGSVCGLLGPNGSGKTTLIRLLVGHLRPTLGELRILGRSHDSDPLGIRRRLGYVADVRYGYDWMTVREILGFTRSFHADWDSAKERSLVRRFSLPPDQKVSQLSRGHRARLSLTLALAYNPELIILDELTAGLDPLVRREVLENLIEEIGREGRTVLFSSHSVDEVERLADEVVIMDSGRVVIDGSVDELKRRVVAVRVPRAFDPAAISSIPGLLSVRRLGSEHHVAIRDNDPDKACAVLAALGEAEVVRLTLEEIFVELLRTPQAQSGEEEK